MDQFYWAALGAAKGVDAARLLALVRSFGSPQDLYGAEEADILRVNLLLYGTSFLMMLDRIMN